MVMAKATKKELNSVLSPLFKEYDRFALGLTTGGNRVPKPAAIEWRGLSLDIQVVRRARAVCGVPFPFAVFEFWYEASQNGKMIVQVGGRPSFIDAVFRCAAKGLLTISED
jgi:hypothetical protein